VSSLPIQQSLLQRIAVLELENSRLKERVDFLEGIPTLRAGIKGERLIAQMLDGRLTVHTAPSDVILTSGIRIEVKYSRLTTPNRKFTNSKRWNWAHPLGTYGGKAYDRLLLIGEADPRFRAYYKDPASPYVFLDLAFAVVQEINRKDHMIQITTDPKRKGGGTRYLLFGKHETTVDILKATFGL